MLTKAASPPIRGCLAYTPASRIPHPRSLPALLPWHLVLHARRLRSDETPQSRSAISVVRLVLRRNETPCGHR